ncbi:MAG: aminopeptidase P family protein [Chloroflexi bacterium]|nr:aminopeptidase P family protein [Chloroflexota bacterium]
MLLNKDRALALIKGSKIDALVATQPENVTYMTDFEAWQTPGAYPYRGITLNKGFQQHAVLTPDGARSLITHCWSEAGALATYGWQVDDLYVYGTSSTVRQKGYKPDREDEKRWLDAYDSESNHTVDAVTALIKLLRKQGVTKGRVGIEFANLAPSAEQQLRREMDKIEFVDCGELLARIRWVKTPDEIARLRTAAAVNEKAVEAMMKAIRPGVTELETKRIYKTVLAQEDGDVDFFTCAGGVRGGFWPAPGAYAFKAGEPVVIDVGCRVNCYHGDTGLCGAVGEPSKKHKDWWKALMEVWQSGVELLRPGNRPSQIYDAMAAVEMKNFGVVKGYFSHGIGIQCREAPFANRMPGTGQSLMDIGEDPPYEPGMVICLEDSMPIQGFGALHREDTFLVTERGCEPLVHTMRDLYVFGT